MKYDEAQIRRVIREGTNPLKKPNTEQIEAIAALTFDSDAIPIVGRMLKRRLDPKAYEEAEVEQTLFMLRICLRTAAEGFVTYVKTDIAPLVSQFHSKAQTSRNRIHSLAGALLSILRDESTLPAERGKYQLQNASQKGQHCNDLQDERALISPETLTSTSALPMTPPDTPRLPRHHDKNSENVPSTPKIIPQSPPRGPRFNGLPTPGQSPANKEIVLVPLVETELDEAKDKVRAATSNTPPASTPEQIEEVVDLTYQTVGLRIVMQVFDARLAAQGFQQSYYHLVKTLTLIHHCLFYASDEFVRNCKRRIEVFEKLGKFQCSNSNVRSRAEAVVHRLGDMKELEKERKSRKMLKHAPNQSEQGNTSKENQRASVVWTKDRSLEDKDVLVEKIGDNPAGFGGFSDVWKGKLTICEGAKNILVAVKVLRLGSMSRKDPERLLKRLKREVQVWRLLDHESIANYYGVLNDPGQPPAIVSAWYVNGCADVYLKNHPQADPLKTVREIVLGVEYLHRKNIVHGDLKGGNVMIDESGHAKLIDFGLSRLIKPASEPSGLTTSSAAFSFRWCAPELITSSDSQTTKASDVYAFASTVLQLLTGEHPYAIYHDNRIIMAIVKGEKPKGSTSRFRYNVRCADQIWALLDSCWNEASLRPTISQLKERLHDILHH